jgi:hypothetical protein
MATETVTACCPEHGDGDGGGGGDGDGDRDGDGTGPPQIPVAT